MTRTEQVMLELLGAATQLAEARRHDSDTAEEWDALERAITAADESCAPSYAFDEGQFVRRTCDRNGESDSRSIDIEDIEQVAITIIDEIDHAERDWFVVDELVAPSGRTWTRCLVAVECLKQLGMLTERALDNRITVVQGFSADGALRAFKAASGLCDR